MNKIMEYNVDVPLRMRSLLCRSRGYETYTLRKTLYYILLAIVTIPAALCSRGKSTRKGMHAEWMMRGSLLLWLLGELRQSQLGRYCIFLIPLVDIKESGQWNCLASRLLSPLSIVSSYPIHHADCRGRLSRMLSLMASPLLLMLTSGLCRCSTRRTRRNLSLS